MAEEHGGGGGGAKSRRSHRNLPEELHEEILRHLPVKSLIRFESVCKTWLSKFHSRRFIALYGRRRHPGGATVYSIPRKKLLEWVTELRLEKTMMINNAIEQPLTYGKGMTRVLGPSSNGIYCLTSHPRKIALCNPSTHDYKIANPFPAEIRSRLSRIDDFMSFELHFGFGQIDSDSDSDTDTDYKVVVIGHYFDDDDDLYSSFLDFSLLGFVYSLRSGEWKTVVDYDPCRRRRDATSEAFYRSRITYIGDPIEVCPQGFFGGCWHWAARCEDNSYYVLSFDFVDEAFKLIGAPLKSADGSFRGSVLTLHDHLAFIYFHDPPFYDEPVLPQYVETDVHVWMMMEYGVEESWTMIYKINPNFYGRFQKLVAIDYTPQKSGGGDEEGGGGVIRIKRLFFEDDNHQLISCDNDGSQVCEASGRWSITTHYFWNTPGISTYVESLERLF